MSSRRLDSFGPFYGTPEMRGGAIRQCPMIKFKNGGYHRVRPVDQNGGALRTKVYVDQNQFPLWRGLPPKLKELEGGSTKKVSRKAIGDALKKSKPKK